MGFRFVFMADCQLGCYASFSGMDDGELEELAARGIVVPATPATSGFAWDAARYREAVAATNALDPAFAVMGGDMVDDPTDPDQYAAVLRITDGLDAPMHWVPGNHDIGVDTNVPTAASMARYRARFGPDHYAFEHDGATIIVVDTVVWVHADAVAGEWASQLAALRRELATARDRPGPVIVCGHHPLFTVAPDEPDDYWNVPLVRRMLLLDLLVDHGVDLYLCGHWHRCGGGRYRGLEVAVTGPVGYPLGTDPSGFRVVDVTDGAVHHEYRSLARTEVG